MSKLKLRPPKTLDQEVCLQKRALVTSERLGIEFVGQIRLWR
jgi:hypothetical protein